MRDRSGQHPQALDPHDDGFLRGQCTKLRRHLVEDIMPFWIRHALDADGGLNTCIQDDGTVVSRDKYLWSQWRAVWVFSKLYNTIAPSTQWLDVAANIYNFAVRHGWDQAVEGWVLGVDSSGAVIRGYESIYVDAFAISGLIQYAQATHSDEPMRLACQTADAVLRRLELSHDQIPHYPYPIPAGARVHGIPMIFSFVLWELAQAVDHRGYREVAAALSDEIFERFYRRDRDVILERVAVDGSELPPPEGTVVVPGHVVEDMWFQIHIAAVRGDTSMIHECCRLIRRHMEVGWDVEYGGLFLAVDADGREEVSWKFADMKIWWPQTEALYALLLSYQHTREKWCLDWYRRVHEYAFAHYPVPEHGEWRQRLDRCGRPVNDVIALPVKDPFHLPRALIYSILTLEKIVRLAEQSR